MYYLLTKARRSLLHLVLVAFALLAFSLVLPNFATQAATGTNKQISFQGKVVNSDGTNVTNGAYNFTFILYSVSSGGSAIWTETRSGGNQVTVTDGVFQVNLGSVQALPGSIDFNTDNIYLGVNFNGNGEMTPRIQFTAVPQAFNALKVAGLTVTDTTGTLTIQNAKTISFADAFTTSGAFATTLTSTGTTNVTLPTTGTLLTNTAAAAQTVTSSQTSGTVIGITDNTALTGAIKGVVITLSGSGVQDQTGLEFNLSNASGTNLNDIVGTGSTWKVSKTGVVSSAGLTLTSGNYTQSGTGTFSTGTGAISLNGDTTIAASKLFRLTGGAGDPTATSGVIWYDSTAHKFKIVENNVVKTLCNVTDAGCGAGGGGASLNQITAATATSTIANANNAIVWNWGTLTTETGLTLGGGSAMTTGSVLAVDGGTTYVHTTAETGNQASLVFADNSTNTSGNSVTAGLNITSSFNTSGAGTKEVEAINIAAATMTGCATGACTWDGVEINTQSTGALSNITQNGININSTGISTGTLNGLTISSITGGAGAETAISIGSGWDTGLDLGTNTLVNIGNAGTDFNSSGGLTLASDLTLSAQGDVRFADADSSHWVALQAPSTVGANVTWTLPDADATGCLKSNGSGTLSIDGACGETDRTNIIASGVNYTKPSNTMMVVVEAWGPGGGGGGGGSSLAGTAATGGGAGGGGAYVTKTILNAFLASTETVTIPSGGTGGNGGTGAAGADGSAATTDTIFGSGFSLVTAYKGGGGANGNASTTGGGGGGGGGAAGAGVNATAATGGAGGNPGGGAAGAIATGNGGGGGGTTTAGAAYYGGGGGGGLAAGGTAGRAGGASIRGGGGGAGGGSLAATHAGTAGGVGGATTVAGGTAGSSAGGTGGGGTAGEMFGGSGGGGGGSSTAGAGGAGGVGGARGGGGGGGGAAGTNTLAGGTGGTGGRGEVIVWTYRGTGADLAEIYGSRDTSLEPGDVVSIDSTMKAGVRKSDKAYDQMSVGVVSTTPGLMMGNIEDIGATPIMVALAGRVPVKASLENGPINPGDLLTPSSVPGVAMKATKAGLIIGQAMTKLDEAMPGYVVAFIKNSYAQGAKLAEIPGIGLLPEDTQTLRHQKALAYLANNKIDLENNQNISEIYTDRLTAALEVIASSVATNELNVGNLSVIDDELFITDASGSALLKLAADESFITGNLSVGSLLTSQIDSVVGLEILSDTSFVKKVGFASFVEFLDKVFLKGEINLEGQVIFNKDTAGIAAIPPTAKSVDVVFEKEYATPPVVNISLRLNDQAQSDQIANSIRAAVTNVSTKGFTIIMNDYQTTEIEFGWIAIGVKDATRQVGRPLVIDQALLEQVTSTPTPILTPTITLTPTLSPVLEELTPSPTSEQSSSVSADLVPL